MALLVLAFIVCWTPLFLFMSVQQVYQFMQINFEKNLYPENVKIFYFCLLCGFANLCVNPFLYYWRNKNFRLGIRKKRKVTDGRISRMTHSTLATRAEFSEKEECGD